MKDKKIPEATVVENQEMNKTDVKNQEMAKTIVENLEMKKAAKDKTAPKASDLKNTIPSTAIEANCVDVNGKVVEIKPTKLKYFRNRSASIYNVLKIVPLTEFLAYEKGVFDPERDSDQILFDFLVAVFDDEDLIHDNYDDINTDTIEKILEIFGRINHINEKEEAAAKKREAQAKH